MHLHVRNVNEAFRELVTIFQSDGDYGEVDGITKKDSRNGPVMMIDEPVIITYEKPKERVLFNQARDCNPFFHVYEALWMLAGRNDVAPLAYYTSNMINYSDDGKTLNGAYGYRWKKHWGYDQLDWIVDNLKANPDDRRQVLQMWDAGIPGRECTGDLYLGKHGSKDVPCNLCVLFLINNGRLDMTVYNRSNDLIWGALGANAVHFSFLQEYMAARIGVDVGVYNQVSNNLHVYLNNWKPEEWLAGNLVDRYGYGTPLVKDPDKFNAEIQLFVDHHQGVANTMGNRLTEPFLRDVAEPMMLAFHHHKQSKVPGEDRLRRYALALRSLEYCKDDAWRIAAVNWIKKRRDKNTL